MPSDFALGVFLVRLEFESPKILEILKTHKGVLTIRELRPFFQNGSINNPDFSPFSLNRSTAL